MAALGTESDLGSICYSRLGLIEHRSVIHRSAVGEAIVHGLILEAVVHGEAKLNAES